VQLNPSSSAAEEVVNQLGHWGNFAAMCLFLQNIQGCLRDGGLDGLQARVNFWLSARDSLAQVSINMKCKQLSSSLNQACLDDHKLPLTCHHLHHTCHSCMICTDMGVDLGGKSYCKTCDAYAEKCNNIALSMCSPHDVFASFLSPALIC